MKTFKPLRLALFGVLRKVGTPSPLQNHVLEACSRVHSPTLQVRQVGTTKDGSPTRTMQKSVNSVSAEVAIQMAQGALKNANADIAISITGIAGPKNDGSNKKVGLVYVGIASRYWANAESTQIGGNRAENKIGFVHFALNSTIKRWDEAMTMAEEQRKEELRILADEEAVKVQFELERQKREEAARESAPWQDDAWDGEAVPAEESTLDTQVEWD
jgi:hypothetical protein